MGLDTLEDFNNELETRRTEPDFDPVQFNEDFQTGISTTGFNKTQPEPAGGINRKGFLRQTTEAVAGGVSDAAEMWMRAIRTVDPEGGNDTIRDFATSGIDAIRNFVSRHPSLAPDANVQEGVKRWWIEGVRSFVPSLSAAIPGVVGGAIVGGPVGAVVGSTFGGAIFGLAEHDRFKEEVEDFITDNELSTEDAAKLREQGASQAIYSAVTEGGLEGAANALEILSLGLFRPVRRTLTGVVKRPIKELFKKSAGQIAKEAAIRLPRTAAIEVGTEVTQEALETKFRRDIGLTDLSSIDAAMSVIGPSLVTTLLFMGAAGGANSFQRYSIRKSLENVKANPNKRKQAVREISDIVRATGQPDSEAIADQLLSSGNRFVDEGISIDLNTQVGVQNSLGEIIKGLRLGELSIETTREYENKLTEALKSEELTGSERIKSTQLLQGISTINRSFGAQAPAKKPKVKKRKATASDKLRDLGDAATTKGKAPVVREEVEEPVDAPEALEALAEEVTEPEAIKAEEIPVEEEVVQVEEERKEERRAGIPSEPITVEMLEAKPSLAFAVTANPEFAADQAAIDKAEEIAPEEKRIEERRKIDAGIISQVFKPILPGVPRETGIETEEEIEALAEEEIVPTEEAIAEAQEELAEVKTEIDEEAQEAATSITNDIPQPSQEQIEAGNYKKGHVALQGLDLSIENPKGSERSGFTEEGEPWTTIAVHHYGYIKGTVGRDKDHLDAYIGDSPESENVFVVNQVNPDTGKFDEHKVMIGFNTAEEARTGYLANYEEGWQGLGSMVPLSMDEFKTWIKGDTTKELKPEAGVTVKKPTKVRKVAITPTEEVLRFMSIAEQRKAYRVFRKAGNKDSFENFTVNFAEDIFNPKTGQPIEIGGIKKIEKPIREEPITPEAKEEIEEVALPEAVPIDVTNELKAVQEELDKATAIFVRAETKGKAKKEAKARVEELQARRKKLRIAAGIELNPVDQAKKNIVDKMGTISLGADPTILKDMTVVGAHHFNSGLKTFVSWSRAMLNDLGSAVKTFLRRVWRSVRRGGIPTDETTKLAKEAVKIEKQQHPEKEMQAEQIKTVEATGKTITEGKETPDIIEQLNHFITHNDYNVLHDDKSKNDIKSVFPDIQDEDISTFARMSGLPYWKAKKFVEWQRALGIEIKRTENKNLLKFEFGRRVFKRSEVAEGSRADIHEFFALKGESETRVSAVILEGDARRTEFTNKSLKEGITTTELDKVTDEYKAFRDKTIKLNEEEITAYRAWQVTMKKIRRQMMDANEILLYKPYEGKPWLKDLRTVVAEKAEQIKPVQATLGLEEQKEEAVVAPELTARDIPKGLSATEQKQFVNAYNTVIKPKSRIQELRKQMGELKGYVPHLRDEGTVKVSFTDKEGQVRDSNILKNDNQANKWITERKAFHKARGNDYTVSKERVSRTPEFLYQEVTASALERFSNKALDRLKASKEGKTPGKITTTDLDEIREAMKQALSDELSARGFGERTLKRTRGPNIGGYRVDDLKNILAGYISGSSGFMTKMEAAYEQGQLLSEIDVKTKPNLYQEISIYGRNMMRNLTRSDQISSKIRTFAFMWYLSGQLKSPTVNFTQNWILGIPVLAKFTTGARRKYNRAMFDVSTNQMSDVERKALLEAGKKGITGDQLMQDIFGQMQQNTNKSVQKVIKILSFPFSASEILNRKFAFLARFRAGIEKGETFNQAFDGAREFVFDVHFLYGKENQAIIASGGTPFSNVLRTSLTFRNYTFNYLNAMKNHIGDRNFMLVGRSMAYMALLGGLSSLPFLEDFLDMWERFTGIPIRKKIQQELKGVGGDVLAVVGTQGLPALIGVDLSGSLRIHLPDPTNPARLFEESVFGVYEGLAVKAKDSFQSILDGEPLRALEQAAPIFIEKPLKAWRVSRDGRVTTKTGKTIFTGRGRPLKITTPEAIIQSIGFRPSKLAFESGKFRQFTNIEANFRNRRTRLFRKFRFAKTSAEKRNVITAIKEYNESARKQRGAVPLITSQSLRRAKKEIPSKRFRAFSRT